jgi:hypothetical protein
VPGQEFDERRPLVISMASEEGDFASRDSDVENTESVGRMILRFLQNLTKQVITFKEAVGVALIISGFDLLLGRIY